MTREILYSPDAEAALVGLALQETDVFGMPYFKPENIHDEHLASIGRVGRQLKAQGAWFDSISIQDELERRSLSTPGLLFPKLIADAVDLPSDGVPEYARIVNDLADRRRAFAVIQKQNSVLFNGNGTWRVDIADLGAQLTPLVTEPEPATLASPIRWASEAWEARPPRPFVVADFLGAGDVMCLYGDGGVGKTWIVCDLAVSVADRQPWLGRAVTQSPVLVIDEESGERRLLDRLERTMRGHGIKPGTAVPIAFASYAGWDFREDVDAGRLHQAITETGAGLVIIDALMDVMLGAEENSVKDVSLVFHNLRRVAQATQAAIIVLHHANKAGGYRGSSAIKGSVESLVSVSKLNEAGTLLRLESDKLRDGEPFDFGAGLGFDKATNSFRLNLAEVHAKGETFSAAEKYVLRTLKEAGAAGASMTAITGRADVCTAETAKRSVHRLVERGFVARIDGGSGTKPGIWAIVAGNAPDV